MEQIKTVRTEITSVWDEEKAEWVNETKTETSLTETREN